MRTFKVSFLNQFWDQGLQSHTRTRINRCKHDWAKDGTMGISPSEACYHGCVITTENGRTGDRRRWIMLIQEFRAMIKHVSGTRHYTADIISHDSAGLTQDQIKQIIKPRDIMVAVINLNTDPQVKASLKELEAHRSCAPWVRKIKENLTKQAIPQTSDIQTVEQHGAMQGP